MTDLKRYDIAEVEPAIPLTGNKIFDDDHSRLDKLLTGLVILSKDEVACRDEVKAFLSCLLIAVDEHFEHEYELMKLCSYHNYEVHRRDHQIIVDELFELVHRVEKLDAMARTVSIRYIIGWFQIHVQVHDVEFCRYMAEVGMVGNQAPG